MSSFALPDRTQPSADTGSKPYSSRTYLVFNHPIEVHGSKHGKSADVSDYQPPSRKPFNVREEGVVDSYIVLGKELDPDSDYYDTHEVWSFTAPSTGFKFLPEEIVDLHSLDGETFRRHGKINHRGIVRTDNYQEGAIKMTLPNQSTVDVSKVIFHYPKNIVDNSQSGKWFFTTDVDLHLARDPDATNNYPIQTTGWDDDIPRQTVVTCRAIIESDREFLPEEADYVTWRVQLVDPSTTTNFHEEVSGFQDSIPVTEVGVFASNAPLVFYDKRTQGFTIDCTDCAHMFGKKPATGTVEHLIPMSAVAGKILSEPKMRTNVGSNLSNSPLGHSEEDESSDATMSDAEG